MLLMRHASWPRARPCSCPPAACTPTCAAPASRSWPTPTTWSGPALTGKHIDVPELLKLLDPAVTVPLLAPVSVAGGVGWFDTPVPEFRLYVADLAEPEVALPGEGPRIALCTAGTAALRGERDQIKLARGESCFVPAADGAPPCRRPRPPVPRRSGPGLSYCVIRVGWYPRAQPRSATWAS